MSTITCNNDAEGSNDLSQLEPNPDPIAESDPEPHESDPEYFNIINVHVTVTHITTGITSNFWFIVGGQHDRDMVSTLDSLTLCTTATKK